MGKWTAILAVLILGLLMIVSGVPAQEQLQVSRLPALPQPLDPMLKEIVDKRHAMGGSVINLTLAQGHAPKLARACVSASAREISCSPRSGLKD